MDEIMMEAEVPEAERLARGEGGKRPGLILEITLNIAAVIFHSPLFLSVAR